MSGSKLPNCHSHASATTAAVLTAMTFTGDSRWTRITHKRKGVRRPLSLTETRLACPYMNTEAPQFCSIGGLEFAGRQYWTPTT